MYSYIDMHCDTLLRALGNENSTIYDGEGMLNIKMMKEAGQLAQFFAVFFPEPDPHFQIPKDEIFWDMLRNALNEQVALHSDLIAMAGTADEIIQNKKEGKMSAVLTIENGRIVNGHMNRLYELRKQGVTAMTLTWNFANCFGYPNSRDYEIMQKGLTDFGKEAIEVMNEIGIIIDVSHLSDGGFWDVAEISKKPFAATHSNSRTLSPHTRNLTDDMVKTLASKGGISGLNFGPEFLSKDINNKDSRIEDLAAHVMYFYKIGGEDFIALGTDFDGVRGNFEAGTPLEMEKLFAELAKQGLTERQLEKFASGNILRVMKEVTG